DHLLTRRSDSDYVRIGDRGMGSTLPAGTGRRPAGHFAWRRCTCRRDRRGPVPALHAHEKHRFLADEPESVVGLARRLSPYELISAGLPACTVMTMRMYARQKGIPLETGATPTRADACHNLTAHELLP